MKRGLGLLMHISSIKEDFGFGCFSKASFSFVDFLAKAKIKYWQVLPLNPPDDYGCPYSNSSFYAINPLFISLEKFVHKIDIQHLGFEEKMDYKKYSNLKMNALRLVYKNIVKTKKQITFEKVNSWWLDNYALYMALKNKFKSSILNFPSEILQKDEKTLKDFVKENKEEINFQKFLQFTAYTQWEELKAYANQKGIMIIGDAPFTVAYESDAVLFNGENFQLEKNEMKFVSGVPGDDFNSEGQCWGNPVYNVKYIRDNDYVFLVDRFKHLAKMFDYIRVDHFRGYDKFYKIPNGKKANEGVWEKSFGFKFFQKLQKEGIDNLILEDLGDIDDSVEKLKDRIKHPGIKVFQFAFDGSFDNEYLPMHYEKNCVAYLGTHDNNTFCGFLKNEEKKNAVQTYLHTGEVVSNAQLTYIALEHLISSNADVVILLPQDLLCQNEKSRMNVPGEVLELNWKYVAPKKLFDKKIVEYLNATISIHNR